MAKCQEDLSARDLICQTYTPKISVICSPEAQAICDKNNLKFSQLIQPFCVLTTDAAWQEPLGKYVYPKNLRLTPVDIETWKPPPLYDAQNRRKILTNVVSKIEPPLYSFDFNNNSENGQEQESKKEDLKIFKTYKLGKQLANYSINVPASPVWYNLYRETFLKAHSEYNLVTHEFLNNFMGCILVITPNEAKTSEDLAAIVNKLNKIQQQHHLEWTNTWILPLVLKFYLLLHDNSVEENSLSSENVYQNMRTMYGANFCHLLKINSKNNLETEQNHILPDCWSSLIEKELPDQSVVDSFANLKPFEEDEIETASEIVVSEIFHPLSPETEYPPSIINDNNKSDGLNNGNSKNENITNPSLLKGKLLTAQDLQNTQIAINEFIAKSLLPYVERQAKILYELIVNRRGMGKSFFSATKRLFGASSKSYSNSVIYTVDSLEMMSRKLADLFFLFGNYSGAYQLYHQLKKDFQADAAWVYYSSSLEMAALSYFMLSVSDQGHLNNRAFPIHYVNESIGHYIDHCRMIDAATRCAILSCECLKKMENYGDAAAIYIRMTSEDCDLRSALMLEQAAYCFLKLNSPRKYALHCVLAGHRYSKAGLKTHSLNCYIQACQIYSGRGWKLAQEHILSSISRHQNYLQIHPDLPDYINSLLTTPIPKISLMESSTNTLSLSTKTHSRSNSSQLNKLNFLRAEYKILKCLNSTFKLALLSLFNLSENGTLHITKLEFDQSDKYTIEDINMGNTLEDLSLNPLESRNSLLSVKLKNSADINEHQKMPFSIILINWKLIRGIELPENEREIKGFYRLEIKEKEQKGPETPYLFDVKHKSNIFHNFLTHPACVCPVQILIHSQRKEKVIVELEKPKEEETGTKNLPKSSTKDLFIIGQTIWILEFEPLNTQKVTYNIAVTKPGVYNVAPNISIKHSISGEERIYNLHSPIIIAQT